MINWGEREGRKEEKEEGGKENSYSQTGFKSYFCSLLTNQDFIFLPYKARLSSGRKEYNVEIPSSEPGT